VPGLFIAVEVAPAAARNPRLARRLEEVCPVGIFRAGAQGVEVVEENLDECTLCDLCLEPAPGQVRVIKLYEE
jgi:NAD-dependent dihydropyrimidine dehydrogenase PreA subunit